MLEILAALAISVVVAYLWRRLEATRVGAVLSWVLVYATLIVLVGLISLGFGYTVWAVLRAAH